MLMYINAYPNASWSQDEICESAFARKRGMPGGGSAMDVMVGPELDGWWKNRKWMRTGVPSGKLTKLVKITIFNGKTHYDYFYGDFQ